MITLTDQLGRAIEIDLPTSRILSLVPSITELVCDLGARERLVGVTKFCVHPEDLPLEKPVVGGTKNVNIAKALALKPDLILASKEENVQEQIEALAEGCPVYVSDVKDLPTAKEMIRHVARILSCEDKGHAINADIDKLLSKSKNGVRRKVAYVIWKKPFMVAGGDSFISAMLAACGFENAYSHTSRYPTITAEGFAKAGCEAIFLSSEPYPFKEEDCRELMALTGLPCLLVDGEAFSWYGSRIPKGILYGRSLKV